MIGIQQFHVLKQGEELLGGFSKQCCLTPSATGELHCAVVRAVVLP